MKLKYFLLVNALFFVFVGFGQSTHTIENAGVTFTPSSLTIQEGDQVEFNIGGGHNVNETDEENYNNETAFQLPGGFVLGLGGGLLTAEDLPVGTHYYYCAPHVSLGMNGIIIVEPSNQTTHIIENAGVTFTPSSLTIQEGDQVQFNIGTGHNVNETDEENYNNETAFQLPGGFVLGFGGGLLTAEDLPIGTHYYYCAPHVTFGMVGIIIVEPADGCPGDLNGDQLRNIEDFIVFNSAFGSNCTGCPEDVNGDGMVNIDDFIDFNSVFGTPCD